MDSDYDVRSGQRSVAHQRASSPREALVEYLRSLGCPRDEIVTVGVDEVAWQGARYQAIPSEKDAVLTRHAA